MPDARALTESYLAAWNADDWEAALEPLHHPEGSIVAPPGWPEPGEFFGWPAIAEQYRRLKDAWAEERIENRRAEWVGKTTLACNRWICRGETSGAEVEVEMWAVTDSRDGLIWRVQYFIDESAARAAAEESAG